MPRHWWKRLKAITIYKHRLLNRFADTSNSPWSIVPSVLSYLMVIVMNISLFVMWYMLFYYIYNNFCMEVVYWLSIMLQLYTVSQKNKTPNSCQYVTTLPCEIWMSKNGDNLKYVLYTHTRTHTHTHTHTHPFNGFFPGLPRWAGTRKEKPVWNLLKQETVSGSGISWAVCKSAPRSRQITTPAPHPSVFTGRMPFLPPDQQRQSTEGTKYVS